MKKLYKFTFNLAICLMANMLQAQIITIPAANTAGTGASGTAHSKPLGSSRSYERTALKYTHSEIGAMGNITVVGFYCDSVNAPAAKTPVKIYMKEVIDSTFTASTVATEETGATLVFSDTLLPAAFVKGNWTSITLTTPFLHATTNNIEVIVETNAAGIITADANAISKGFRYSTVAGPRMEYWRSNSGVSTTIPTGAGTTVASTRCNIQFTIIASPCTAPPTAGTAVASFTTVCSGSAVNLSLTGNSVGVGQTYQWQSSPNGTTWTNINGATNAAYTATVSAVTYYSCVVTCSGQSSTSTSVQVNITPFTQCYCTGGLGGNCTTTAIDSVGIVGTTLANGLTGCSAGNYTAYPFAGSTTATLNQGQSYSLKTKFTGNTKTSVWIDYNHNGVFDNSEWTQVCLTSVAGAVVSSSINVPSGALLGMTGMRIRSRGNTAQNDSTTACANFGSGETEDYLITIGAGASCTAPPIAGTTTASVASVCPGGTVVLSLNGNSTGIGQTYQWQSSPNGTTWSNIAGATSPVCTTTLNTSTYYSCVLSCSGQSSTSTTVQVTINPFYNCYCTSGIGGACTAATAVDSVAITGSTLLNGPLTCPTNNYIQYPASGNTTASLAQGITYTLSTRFGGNVKASVWIDYNRNGIYENTEWKQICVTSTAGTTIFTNIPVPFTAQTGLTGMRIRSRTTGGTNDSTSACTNFANGETQDYVITITAGAACTAPPTAGTTVASPTVVCSGSTVNLSLNGNSVGVGQTYQWQSSPDGTTWTNIPGATGTVCTVTVTAATYYSCVITCSGQSSSSAAVQVTLTPFTQCYCTSGIGGGCTGTAIDSVAIATTTLANGLTGCSTGNYTAYPASGATTASLAQGVTYTLTTKFTGAVKGSVWVDYNQNGVFETTEWKQICTTSTAGTNVSINLTIPFTSLLGQTGMRIRSRSTAGANDSTSACAAFGSGETEDYLITIIPGTNCTAPPTAGISAATPTTVCSGTPINLSLSGNSTGTGQTYQWQSSPNGTTWTNINGATLPTATTTAGTSTTYYSCVVTCSGQSASSSTVQVTVNPFYNCYCTAGIGGGCTTTAIDSVAIATTTLNNGPTGCSTGNYTMYPAAGNTTATLLTGMSYTLNTRFTGNVIASVWIDYNQSGTFDISEWKQVCLTSTALANIASVINVPANAMLGMTGMRVRSRTTANQNDSTSACTTFGSGETEDYLLTIAAGTTGIKNTPTTQVYVFPNPTNGIVNVGLSLAVPSKVNYLVTNMTGEVVYNEQTGLLSGIVSKSFDLSGFAKGIYFIRVITDKEIVMKKIILQ